MYLLSGKLVLFSFLLVCCSQDPNHVNIVIVWLKITKGKLEVLFLLLQLPLLNSHSLHSCTFSYTIKYPFQGWLVTLVKKKKILYCYVLLSHIFFSVPVYTHEWLPACYFFILPIILNPCSMNSITFTVSCLDTWFS